MADYTQKQNISTMVRNFYADGISYINIKFYNLSLSFQFHRFLNKDSNGRSSYDTQNSLMTTINWEGAFALYKISKDIIDGKMDYPCSIMIPCASDAALILERKPFQSANGMNTMETIFSIRKNNDMIPFKFKTHQIQIMENGQSISKPIESGLGAFQKTIEGYLIAINGDRHLDKLTEAYVANQSNKGNFNNNNNYNKKPWQKKQYNNNNYNQPVQQQGWETQNMSSYQLPN